MSVRIRYKETAFPGVYQSVQSFMTKEGVVLKAVYDTNLKEVILHLEGNPDEVAFKGPYTNVHAAKIKLKKMLKEAGVTFTDEVRRKKE